MLAGTPSLHPLYSSPSILAPYRRPEEEGLIVIDVIECNLEGLHGLVGWLSLVAGHDDQLWREEKGRSWAKPCGAADTAEVGTVRTAGGQRILGGFNRELGACPPGFNSLMVLDNNPIPAKLWHLHNCGR